MRGSPWSEIFDTNCKRGLFDVISLTVIYINELSVGNFKEIRPLKNAKKKVKEMSVGLVAGAVIIIVLLFWE